jgi:hypothetical protein
MKSRTFYTLIEKREDYKKLYEVVDLNDDFYIKIELPPVVAVTVGFIF